MRIKMPRQDRRQIFPEYSKNAVDRAWTNIKNAKQNNLPVIKEDEDIIENWRASHAHILNTWQVILRKKLNGKKVIFAQRLKRKNTIYDKLMNRSNISSMAFTRMHDIAGCRLVFQNEKELRQYIENLHTTKTFHHIRKDSQCKDYILSPKKSGYRGIHDVYAYKSKKGNDRSDKWNGLLIEIQYRTIYQHAWATAVEIADYLTQGRTKFSQGTVEYQDFFRYASEIIARAFEGGKSCLPDLSNEELIKKFNELSQKTKLLMRLKQLRKISKSKIKFGNNIVMHFKLEKGIPNVDISSFDSLPWANRFYFNLENEHPKDDIVLVKSDKKKNILEAYRNYFADAKDFTEYVDEGIKILSLF